MKRFALLAICAMAVLAGCQQKGKSEGQTSGTVATDSLGEVTDTVPKPIFLIKRMSFFEMNYWTDVEEPSKEQLDEEQIMKAADLEQYAKERYGEKWLDAAANLFRVYNGFFVIFAAPRRGCESLFWLILSQGLVIHSMFINGISFILRYR